MMSPHPDARSRNGDSAMTPVSMMTAIGVWAARLTFSPSLWIQARDDTTPSWLAAARPVPDGTPALEGDHLGTANARPPPTPTPKATVPLPLLPSPPRTRFLLSPPV